MLVVDEIRRVYAGNRSTEVVNIWCDSVGKLGTYTQKNRDGAFPPPKKKISKSYSFETTGPIEKSRGYKNGTDISYLQAKLGVFVFLFVTLEILNMNKGWAYQRFSHSNGDIVAICRSSVLVFVLT